MSQLCAAVRQIFDYKGKRSYIPCQNQAKIVPTPTLSLYPVAEKSLSK